MFVHRPSYTCIQGFPPYAHTGIHHVCTEGYHTYIFSEIRTCLCTQIPHYTCICKGHTYIYRVPIHVSHVYTETPPSLICTSRPYHTCAYRNSIITYVSMTLVPTGMYTQTCHRYTHCTYDHRDTIMCTYRNLFHVYTQGPHYVYTKVPHHPYVHRDSIMYAFKELHTHMFLQGPHHACTLRTPSHRCSHRALCFLIL